MKKILVFTAILLVSACGNQSIRPDNRDYSGLEEAKSYYQNNDFEKAALAYVQLYQSYGNDEFAFKAADSWIQAQQYLNAENLLNNISIRKHPLHLLVLTELALFNQHENSAINYFNKIKIDKESEYFKKYLLVKSKLYKQNYNYLESALALVELSQIDDFIDYNETIINLLSMVSEQDLTQALFQTDHTPFEQAWLEAAYVGFSNDPNSVNQWKLSWPDHPGIDFFLSSVQYNKIAVLLPFSGRYQNIAKSIQQGMIAAMYPSTNMDQELLFFDTGSDGESFASAWYGAMESAAEFIIGPLEKKSINQLKQLNSSTVPVLLLNEFDEENVLDINTDLGVVENPFGFYQFSLSPEDEAKNIAARLIAENKKRVLLLGPESEMGRRVAVAFEKEFNFDDGQIVNYAFYPITAHDYSNEMKSILGLLDSRQRIKRLERILAVDLSAEAQIRPDIDAIVIFANANQARLIKPQLKFFRAEDVPVYTTSQVFSGTIDPVLDKDLNGIKFSQSKFITDPEIYDDQLQFDVNKITSNKKFFAFGYDAFALSSRVELMYKKRYQKLEGLSGLLSIDSKGAIHRELSWAQFRRGIPQVLEDIVEVIKPIDTEEQELNINNDAESPIESTEF